MNLQDIPFQTIQWNDIPVEEHAGITGMALWKTVRQGNVRVRIVEYSPGYLADHWCEKGHVIFVVDGEFLTELKDGRAFRLTKGMSYIVADAADAHRSSTTRGVTLLIVD